MAITHRIFISFAIEDERYRDFLRGQARNDRSPFDFVDMSLKEPFDERWKTQCRSRIRGCDGLIALVSHNTWYAEGARWEMHCAAEEGIRSLGIHIHSDDRGLVPPELRGAVIDWSWKGIKGFLDCL